MAKMYYAETPDSPHDVHDLSVTLLGERFNFWTDSGVFSKKMIDYGSQALLNALDISIGASVLDIGCGYGPLGIALAKHFKAYVTMVDVNSRALDLAHKNAQRNGVTAEIFQSSCYQNVEGTFDEIISNPPIRAGKDIVYTILSESIDYLNVGGHLTVVIQKKQGAPSAQKKMKEVFGNVAIVKKDKGYYILRSEKL